MATARHDDVGRSPEGPLALGRGGWWSVIRRTVAEFREDNATDWAAALTYYAVLSVFPAILAMVSVVGLIGTSATQTMIENLNSFAPGPARDVLSSWLHNLSHNQGGAGLVFVFGLGGSIWAASGYVGAFMRAANAIWDAPEGRPFWKTIPLRLAVTVFAMIVLVLGSIAVVVTGPVAQRAGDLLGVGSATVTAWEIAKWPLVLLLLAGLLAVLYYAAPNVRQPGARWVTPGRRVRDRAVDRGLGAVRRLRRHLRLIQQDLRRGRRHDRVPGLVMDLEHRRAAGCRARRRAGPRTRRRQVTHPTRSHS